MWNVGRDEIQARVKIARRNIDNLRNADYPTLIAEKKKKRKTKTPIDESERGEWKLSLKLNIQKMKIMVSSPITSWQIDGETMEIMTYFISWGSKITADGDYSHEIKRHFLLGRRLGPT